MSAALLLHNPCLGHRPWTAPAPVIGRDLHSLRLCRGIKARQRRTRAIVIKVVYRPSAQVHPAFPAIRGYIIRHYTPLVSIYYSIVCRQLQSIEITAWIATSSHYKRHTKATLHHAHPNITASSKYSTNINAYSQCSLAPTTSVDAEADATPPTAAAIAVLFSTFNQHAATAHHQHLQPMDDQQLPTQL